VNRKEMVLDLPRFHGTITESCYRLSLHTRVTFLDSDSATVLKFLNPDPTPKFIKFGSPTPVHNPKTIYATKNHIFPKPCTLTSLTVILDLVLDSP